MLEVGSSLGRTFFEVCKRIQSMQSATLIEPSQNLFTTFDKIFAGAEAATVSILKGPPMAGFGDGFGLQLFRCTISRAKTLENLRPIPRKLPFSGDAFWRLSSIATAWLRSNFLRRPDLAKIAGSRSLFAGQIAQ